MNENFAARIGMLARTPNVSHTYRSSHELLIAGEAFNLDIDIEIGTSLGIVGLGGLDGRQGSLYNSADLFTNSFLLCKRPQFVVSRLDIEQEVMGGTNEAYERLRWTGGRPLCEVLFGDSVPILASRMNQYIAPGAYTSIPHNNAYCLDAQKGWILIKPIGLLASLEIAVSQGLDAAMIDVSRVGTFTANTTTFDYEDWKSSQTLDGLVEWFYDNGAIAIQLWMHCGESGGRAGGVAISRLRDAIEESSITLPTFSSTEQIEAWRRYRVDQEFPDILAEFGVAIQNATHAAFVESLGASTDWLDTIPWSVQGLRHGGLQPFDKLPPRSPARTLEETRVDRKEKSFYLISREQKTAYEELKEVQNSASNQAHDQVTNDTPSKLNSCKTRAKQIIVEQLGVSIDELTPEASFVDDLAADSLDLVELVMAFEEEYEIEIPDDESEKIKTVGQAIKYLDKKRKQ